VSGDDGDEVKAYSFSAPGLSANKGVSEGNFYSVFGGIGISATEEYQLAIDRIAVVERLEAAGYIDSSSAREQALAAYSQLVDATQPKRVLGVLWKTRGRHLGNLFGLASMDDLRGRLDLSRPEGDSEVTGNGGNF
jgi:hypothetical protein